MEHNLCIIKRINIVTTQNSLGLCTPDFIYGLLKDGQYRRPGGAQIPAD
jgi:hypothetical protein